jgi:hypothetical protein
LFSNYEYGVGVDDGTVVAQIELDLLEYAALGARVEGTELANFCEFSLQAREAFREQMKTVAESARAKFAMKVRDAEDQLVRLRLARGACHTVFAKTIVYVLRRNGPLDTARMHPLIEKIHPDLCDNTVDRVIDGKRYGKKWKHAVRTAQQMLKREGVIELRGGNWTLTEATNTAQS